MKSHLQSANEKSFPINLQVTVTFQKVVTLPKSRYFSKSRYFPKSSYFPNRHNFSKKLLFFSKRHNFLDKMGLNRFHRTDMFLAENGYKRKSIFDFLITENFSFSAFIFSLKIKSKCRSTESVWRVAVLQFVEVKEVWGTTIFFNRFNPFYLGRN